MSDVRHERHFGDFRGTSAYPPRLAVKADILDRQVCARKRHMRCSKIVAYSISASARCWSCKGTSRPSIFAVLRLITSSNLTGA